ncbi:MAG: GGDEF domain-containing protein [Lysobacteraceae bacterium]|nr:MAG: GGDEF domain-containing protein [Xanthomonadaceae bacterium]
MALLIGLPLLANGDIHDLGELHFQSIGQDEKRVSGAITALTQDRSGVIWLGTQHGLARYDGYQFEFFTHDSADEQSLVGNFIASLWAAPDGRIWVGTRSSGAAIFDPVTERFRNFSHDPEDPGSLADNRVSAIVGEANGRVWLGTNDGLDLFQPGAAGFIHHRADPGSSGTINDNHIRSLLIDSVGGLWVGSYDGLNYLMPGGSSFERRHSDPNDPESLANHVVFRLLQSKDNALWVGTPRNGAIRVSESGQLQRLSPNATLAHQLPHPWVTALAQTADDAIWVGTNGGGLTRVDPTTARIQDVVRHHPALPSSINDDDIGSLLVDESGQLWVGTWGSGLNLHNPGNAAFRTLRSILDQPETLSHPHVLSVLELQDGPIWIGTQGNGIDIFDPHSGRRTGGFRFDPNAVDGLADPAIHAMAQSPDGTIWVGTLQSGLQRYRPATQDFDLLTESEGLMSDQVRRLLAAPNNDLWIGTYRGLSRWNNRSQQLESIFSDLGREDFFAGTVVALELGPRNELWVGTDSGLFRVADGSNVAEPIKLTVGNQHVNSLMMGMDGMLWLGTPHGPYLLDPESENPSSSVRALFPGGNSDLGSDYITDDSGRVWTTTHLISSDQASARELSPADGVDYGTPWDGASEKLSDGTIVFGGTQGLLMIQPQRFEQWRYEPPMVISKVTLDGQERSLGPDQPLLIPATSRSFTVEFAALDYSAPDQVKYAYRLRGYDPDWTETSASNRHATYTNLDPGSYRLMIKGSNRLKQWSPQQIYIDIHKEPAWHQTLWFRLLIGLLIIATLYVSYRLRLRQLHARERSLQRLVSEQTSALKTKNVELQAALEQVSTASITDPLTGLHNRRYLQRELCNEQTATGPAQVGIFLIDIDHFKAINDQHGHTAGDAVLSQVAKVLRESLNDADILVRWGGEEFLSIIQATSPSKAATIAARLQTAFEQTKFDVNEQHHVRCTCSIGFAAMELAPNAQRLRHYEQLINIADRALYAAKNSGRNAWVGLIGTDTLDHNAISELQNSTAPFEHGVAQVVSSLDTDNLNWR